MTNICNLIYAKSAETAPLPQRSLSRDRKDNVPPDIQNHLVICDPVTGNIYTYTMPSKGVPGGKRANEENPGPTEECFPWYRDAKVIGTVDFSRVIFFEYKHGPLGREHIQKQMDASPLSVEEKQRVWKSYGQLRYVLMSKKAFGKPVVKGIQNHFSYYDITTDKILTGTKLLKTRPRLKHSHRSDSHIVGTIYLNRTAVCLADTSGPCSSEQIQKQADTLELSETERRRLLRAQNSLRYLVLSPDELEKPVLVGTHNHSLMYDKTTDSVYPYTRITNTKPEPSSGDPGARTVATVYLGQTAVRIGDKFGRIDKWDIVESMSCSGWSHDEISAGVAAWEKRFPEKAEIKRPKAVSSGLTPAVLKYI